MVISHIYNRQHRSHCQLIFRKCSATLLKYTIVYCKKSFNNWKPVLLIYINSMQLTAWNINFRKILNYALFSKVKTIILPVWMPFWTAVGPGCPSVHPCHGWPRTHSPSSPGWVGSSTGIWSGVRLEVPTTVVARSWWPSSNLICKAACDYPEMPPSTTTRYTQPEMVHVESCHSSHMAHRSTAGQCLTVEWWMSRSME